MITQDELEMFIDALISPVYAIEARCKSDSCPIDWSSKEDDN